MLIKPCTPPQKLTYILLKLMLLSDNYLVYISPHTHCLWLHTRTFPFFSLPFSLFMLYYVCPFHVNYILYLSFLSCLTWDIEINSLCTFIATQLQCFTHTITSFFSENKIFSEISSNETFACSCLKWFYTLYFHSNSNLSYNITLTFTYRNCKWKNRINFFWSDMYCTSIRQ